MILSCCGPARRYVAGAVDRHANVRPLRNLPSSLCGGGCGLSFRVVHSGHAGSTTRGAGDPGAEGGPETGGACGAGRHSGYQPEGEAGVHAEGGTGPKPPREKLKMPAIYLSSVSPIFMPVA